MKKAVKSYLAFSSLGYRIVCMLVAPVLLLALAGLVLVTAEECNGIFPEYFLFCYVVGFEVMSDFWMLCGVCSREGRGLEYAKTSRCGVSVLQKCAAVDSLRRFVYMMGFGLFCFAFTGYVQDFVTALIAYLVVTAVLNLTRHFVLWQAQILACFLAAFVSAMLTVAFWLMQWAAAELIILGAAAAAVSAVSVWHVGDCMRRSYYEK